MRSSSMLRSNAHRFATRLFRPHCRQSSATKCSPGAATALPNFYSLTEDELKATLTEWGQPGYRAKQIRNWVLEKGVVNFQDMVNLPAALRDQLQCSFQVGVLSVHAEQISRLDGTRKLAYRLSDGQLIESVLMKYNGARNTACISSQAGCGQGCSFCATGQMGFGRQLSSAEIFEQAQRFSVDLKANGRRLSNIVFMGMGEPLANYANTLTATRRIMSELGIGARHITISTVGLAPKIRKLADEKLQVGLAVSLHQSTDARRSLLMPVNERYPLAELLDACRYYVDATNRRISFQWAMIAGDTDTPEAAHKLGRLLEDVHCHVNVIPLNPTRGFDGEPTSKKGVSTFINILSGYGVPCTPRMRRGIDIEAGCGQLKAELLRRDRFGPSAEERRRLRSARRSVSDEHE